MKPTAVAKFQTTPITEAVAYESEAKPQQGWSSEAKVLVSARAETTSKRMARELEFK